MVHRSCLLITFLDPDGLKSTATTVVRIWTPELRISHLAKSQVYTVTTNRNPSTFL